MTIELTENTHKPRNSAFKQQRLPAWNPILTPRNVLPTLFGLSFVLIALGIALLLSSNSIVEFEIDYTNCISSATNTYTQPSDSSLFSGEISQFQWKKSNDNKKCFLQFTMKKDLSSGFFYYKLTNYYQNHRLYVKSLSLDQLKGVAVPRAGLDSCSPLIGPDNSNLVYYPCGLIANSIFNDTFSSISNIGGSAATINLSDENIAWPSDAAEYKTTSYSLDQIVAPPSWRNRDDVNPDGTYKSIPTLGPRFQVWMRLAGLPSFRKLYGTLDAPLKSENTYEISIDFNYDVTGFKGTKSVVISTVNWIGGKNSFLGIAYLTVGSICCFFGLFFLAKQLISPRKIGDSRYLSWNSSTE